MTNESLAAALSQPPAVHAHVNELLALMTETDRLLITMVSQKRRWRKCAEATGLSVAEARVRYWTLVRFVGTELGWDVCLI